MDYAWCKICNGGYDDIDQLEYHLQKEHTKNEYIHYLKIQTLKEMKK